MNFENGDKKREDEEIGNGNGNGLYRRAKEEVGGLSYHQLMITFEISIIHQRLKTDPRFPFDGRHVERSTDWV